MTQTELPQLSGSGTIRDIDLSNRQIENIDFSDRSLEGVRFDNATLTGCNFDRATIKKVSFRKATLRNCRFRRAVISWSDFRYCEIEKATFEEAAVDFCDFYRAILSGIVIMRKARISRTSLYYTHFCEGVNIRRENLVGGKLLQQDKTDYLRFLIEWNTSGTGERKNDQQVVSTWDPGESLHARWADAEDIYKNLNGLWSGAGFMRDANWAYVKGRKMERKRMCAEWTKASLPNKVALTWKISTNFFMDIMFGYGESMLRMILTYIFLIFIFAFVFFGNAPLPSYMRAFGISLKNMVGVGSEELNGVSPLVDMLNILQTTMGILLTGIFGFILGNKIRNQ